MRLNKYDKNPILSPHKTNAWETLAVCNPGAYYDKGTVYLLYRAAGNDKAHHIHMGLATSRNGFDFKRVSTKPAISPSVDGFDAGCIEDPRITKMDGHFYITYAFRPFPPGRYWEKKGYMPEMPYLREKNLPKFTRENLTMSGLLITKDFKKFVRVGALTSPLGDNRDAILFPEKINGGFAMLHRPIDWVGPKFGCSKPSMWMAFGKDPLHWESHKLVAKPEFRWESKKIGGSTPPLRTSAGWLTLYHGVDENNVYRTGVMMLDLKKPWKVIARAPDFIMEPEYDYETRGVMSNVVFPTGNVVIKGTLFVYYGAGDKHVGVATAPLAELVRHVMRHKVKK